MTVKEKILNLLESNRGVFYSGEAIAQNLDVSRAAVWKAMKCLREDGYPIDAVNNKGYCLSADTDILSPQGIQKYLNPSVHPDVHVLNSLSSTNSLLKELAAQSTPEGYTIAANSQTAGRGRSGRNFYSPRDSGVYLSILLRPENCSPTDSVRITTVAAVAMCQAIRDVSDKKPGIKWVNDIFVEGKKVCGILTEGSFNLETGLLDYAVLGAGINVYDPREGFPQKLESIAGAIFHESQPDIKNRLTAAFFNHFWELYLHSSKGAIAEQYRAYSIVLGKKILVLQNGTQREAIAQDIDESCHLLVTYPDGREERLSYGEIRIQMQ